MLMHILMNISAKYAQQHHVSYLNNSQYTNVIWHQVVERDSGLMGCYGHGLMPCSARHIRFKSASFTHLHMMWTTFFPLNLYRN